ncbi:hypothetical protein H4R35_006510, partial [Dimargaris xerosporica]
QNFPSCSATTQPDPLHTLTLSHASTLHETLPIAAVQPLVDYAAMHTQSQYLDAVVLGCFAYAYNSIIMGVHLDVLHEASPGEQTGFNGHYTANSRLSVQTNDAPSLARMVNVAKQVVYNLPSTSDPSNNLPLTEDHGDVSILYHAVASASAHLAKQSLIPLLASPFYSTLGYAKGYACEAMATISNDGLTLMVTGNPEQTAESTLHALMDAWRQALAQYQSNILGTVDALSLYDYPLLLPLDRTQFHALTHEVKAALKLTNCSAVDMLPTSNLQDGFIINTLKDPSAYMVQMAFHLDGPLDVDRYHQCWMEVGQRHSILRTKFVTTDLIPGYSAVQVVLPSMDIAWSYETDHQLLTSDKESQYLALDRQHGFAFDSSPLLRLALFKIDDTDHLLFFSHHHALLDGWSLNIVFDEVMTLYHRQALGPVVQYSSYLGHLLRQPEKATQCFWQDLLHEVTPTPDLQLPSTRPPLQNIAAESYGVHGHTLQCPLSAIHTFCQTLGITTNNLLRGLWALLLHRYLEDSGEVTFGVLVSGRNVPVPGIDDMVGMCINTVPFRAKFNNQQPLHNWLQATHRISGEIMAHEHASLVDIQQWANVPTDMPLFQSLLVYDKYRDSQLQVDDQEVQMRSTGGLNFTEYPLAASFYDQANNLCVALTYKTDKYDDAYASLLCAHLDACLARIIASTPSTPIDYVQQLPESEYNALMAWSQGAVKTLDPACVLLPDLFTRSLHRCPHAIALESGSEQWTYAQVHQQAVAIAQWLIAHQVQPGDCVALVFTRSPQFVFAVLAVLLVGGVYVPIDATVTAERIGGILADLSHPLVLFERNDTDLVERLTPMARKIGFCNTMAFCPTTDAVGVSAIPRNPHDLAYVIFTSGTTGKPKGVQVRHESAVNILIHLAQTMELDSTCRFLQLLNIAFDGCLIELFLAFYAGGTVLISMSDVATDLHNVNTCGITPSLMSVLNADDYPNLQKIICGGEALPWSTAAQWQSNRTMVNIYGPTEITVSSHVAPVGLTQCITLGGPVPNTQCYVLDAQQRPVPIGIAGEICIAGIGVSNGYLNRPDLTAKVFVPNPFGSGQMYFTGDLGCWLPNGKIKYLGRKDFQVKLRGFRIELSEVEQAILKHPLVTAACAIAQDGKLAAFVTPSACDPQSITQLISQSLPSYMVPAVIAPLDALPLTRIGKIDRKALPRVDFDQLQYQEIVPPQTPMETTLVGILAEVLMLNNNLISTRSTFFQLGGNSLTAIRLVAKCRQQGFVLAIADINRTHTIVQLAQRMESQNAMVDCEAYPNVSGPVRLTPIQCEFLAERFQWPQAYLSPFVLQCSTAFAFPTWETVVSQLLSYHDMLRFHLADEHDSPDTPMGVIESSLDVSRVLAFYDVNTEAELHAIAVEACAKVDYRTGPICQFRV